MPGKEKCRPEDQDIILNLMSQHQLTQKGSIKVRPSVRPALRPLFYPCFYFHKFEVFFLIYTLTTDIYYLVSEVRPYLICFRRYKPLMSIISSL